MTGGCACKGGRRRRSRSRSRKQTKKASRRLKGGFVADAALAAGALGAAVYGRRILSRKNGGGISSSKKLPKRMTKKALV